MIPTLPPRISTHVPGLDLILDGGLLQGGVYIVRGTPGAGKTILSNQMCFGLARAGARSLYLTLLAEAHERLLAHLSPLAFFDGAMVGTQITYLSAFRVLEQDGLDGLLRLLRETFHSASAALIVLDGLVTIEESSTDDREFKRFIHDLQTLASLTGTTVLMLSSGQRQLGSQPEHTIVDGILELGEDTPDMRAHRYVQVRKLRGGAPIRGRHMLQISDAGIEVLPRIETRSIIEGDIALPSPEDRLAFDVPELEAMTRGGLPRNSVTMLLGPSGCGKTMLALHFLAAGARTNEPALYFGFYEQPDELLAKSARIGLGLADAVRSGQLQFVWQRPVEGMLDVLADRLLATVRDRGIKRLVIDGMHSFQRTIDYPERLRDVIAAVEEQLQRAGVTTVYTLEAPKLFDATPRPPLDDLSASSHNIIVLHHQAMPDRIARRISVVKMRDSDHDDRIHEFRITDRGIVISALS